MEITEVGVGDYIKRSYLLKLLLILLLVVATVTVVGFEITVQTNAQIEERTESSMVQSATQQSEYVAEWIDHRRGDTAELASSEAVQSGNTERIRSTLRDEHEGMDPAVLGIHYVDGTSGEILASTENEAEGTSLAGTPEPSGADENNEPTLFAPTSDETFEGTVSGFVAQTGGESDALVMLVFDLDRFGDSLGNLSATSGSATHVVNSDGTIVVSQDDSRIGESIDDSDEGAFESDGLQRGLEGESGYVETETELDDHDGAAAIGYAPVDGTDWVLTTTLPTSEAYSLHEEVTRYIIVLLLVLLMGTGLVGIVVGRSTSQAVKSLTEKTQALENGDFETEIETDRRDEIGQLSEAVASLRDSFRSHLQEVHDARQEAEQQREELEAHTKQLVTEAREVHTAMQRAAAGDLTVRLETNQESEAIQDVAREYNRFMNELTETISNLDQFADEATGHGDDVMTATDRGRRAGEDAMDAVRRIGHSTSRQHDAFRTVAEEMETVSASTEEITSHSSDVASLAKRSAAASQEGASAAKTAVAAIDEIETKTETTFDELREIQDQLDRIEELAESIQEAANETTFVAMNANIEAARSDIGTAAGGEEFGDVTAEIKALSTETKSSAEEITELVDTIQTTTNRTAADVRTVQHQLAASADTVDEAIDAFEEILGYVQRTYNGTKAINEANRQQADAVLESVTVLNEAESLSHRVADDAQTAVTAIEEQSTALTRVTDRERTFINRTQELQRYLETFDITESQTDAVRPPGE